MIQLKLNPKNPRRINDKEFERLKNKIKEFPDMLLKRPIVYDENNVVLGGNMRYRALQQLENEGLEIKEEYFSGIESWTEEQKENFIINDNVSDGNWDYDLLANKWDYSKLSNWGALPDKPVYEPKIAPEFAGQSPTEQEINKKANELAVQMIKQNKGIAVTCPHCGGSFDIQP